MDRLWTPWRFDYIRGLGEPEPGCVFCRIVQRPDEDRQNLVLYRGSGVFMLLNLFPYTAGHILVVANRHIPFLSDATADELGEFACSARRCEEALRREYRPDDFNIGFNLGRAAGAGVEDHIHMHVIPRWAGDSNFVSVVGETRILPEELPRTWERLVPYFRS